MGTQDILAKLQDGVYGNEGEVLEWSYWDTADIAAATLTHRLFTSGLGVGGKTMADTNMTTSGTMPQGQHLIVDAVKIMYAANDAFATADVLSFYTMLSETTASIEIANKKSMGQWTLQELLGCSLLNPLTPSAAGDNIPMIQPRFTGVYLLNEPVTLAALTTFEVTITHHVAPAAALADDRLKIALSGLMIRAT